MKQQMLIVSDIFIADDSTMTLFFEPTIRIIGRVILGISIFGATIPSEVLAQSAQSIANVKPDAQILAKIKSGKVYLVDVRTPDEFDGGHLQYAINIDFFSADFRPRLAKLDKKKPVYLYCRSGNRSGKSEDTLKALGFKHFYNIGGFEKLREQGFPASLDPVLPSVPVVTTDRPATRH